jgi:hypothetical protein
MRQKTYFLASAAVFLVVAAAHLTRLVMGWEVTIGGWAVPRWVSVPGLVVPGILSAWGFVLASDALRPG